MCFIIPVTSGICDLIKDDRDPWMPLLFLTGFYQISVESPDIPAIFKAAFCSLTSVIAEINKQHVFLEIMRNMGSEKVDACLYLCIGGKTGLLAS